MSPILIVNYWVTTRLFLRNIYAAVMAWILFGKLRKTKLATARVQYLLNLNTLYGCKTTLVYPVKMEYGLNLFISSIYYMYIHHNFFIENPPCALKVLFITEFAISCKIPHFYELNELEENGLRMEEFQNIFF